ncbi:DUF1178 family protein [Candidatus Pandoraea novymonadis]|uniref:Regulatory protein FmdB Zinc ribbon domain-containing protein n=1 Tax=Candidatus Pandoraea novymonadis TaxID=1808959 RepID=A0ABX5FEX8_9BURK|nr:DUF1178 family protein [Candidatus Pandoraea novymonadis]PSB91861.1 hypothetical protein BZL35_00077 [Candidatus Pandoraea novymonadis]
MKVFDLHCVYDHIFEGWFSSEADFFTQQERGLLVCPICGDATVTRLPSAPRLNLSGATIMENNQSTKMSGVKVDSLEIHHKLQNLWMKAVRHVIETTEDVGDRFVEEARRIHYHEAPERNICGNAALEETLALVEEGIDVMLLPLPKGVKETLQ